ncbi:peptidylprolyl isomerase [Desulfurivibrio alkaliphilus]|uniref:peptidylprolyl isomerase n=1 Tax=Desulfurivibrio alkaliphilus (strain DSM 19089 / UNIQEM U267 / AHT2) TaxID=589865 RepID=D6Z1Q8_DESAT|nr:peptidyl-prolyl cis-trans isomerase [Desulfurivibrio alkaliphilus]ADH85483.1 hypothetical protein DaAHT2_0779 [Desulfurivibrio alkaliphilus AHT 2]
MKLLIVPLLTLSLLLSACSGDPKEPPVAAADEGMTVATVDGARITMADVRNEMELRPEATREFFRAHDGAARFVDSLVTKEVLYQEARRRGLDQEPQLRRVIDDYARTLLVNTLIEQELAPKVQFGEEDLQEYYRNNPEEFMTREKVRLSRIVVGSAEEAQQVRARLLADEDFAAVAQDLSLEQETAAGGDLGFVERDALSEREAHLAFNVLGLGDISSPQELAENRFVVIKLTDLQGETVPYEEIKNLLAQRMETFGRKAAFEDFVATLKQDRKIEFSAEAIQQLMQEAGHGSMM